MTLPRPPPSSETERAHCFNVKVDKSPSFDNKPARLDGLSVVKNLLKKSYLSKRPSLHAICASYKQILTAYANKERRIAIQMHQDLVNAKKVRKSMNKVLTWEDIKLKLEDGEEEQYNTDSVTNEGWQTVVNNSAKRRLEREISTDTLDFCQEAEKLMLKDDPEEGEEGSLYFDALNCLNSSSDEELGEAKITTTMSANNKKNKKGKLQALLDAPSDSNEEDENGASKPIFYRYQMTKRKVKQRNNLLKEFEQDRRKIEALKRSKMFQ